MHVQNQSVHVPVLLGAVLQYLAPAAGESYLDLTAGYGGHAAAVLALTTRPDRAVLIDRDADAIAALQPWAEQGALLLHQDFRQASRDLLSQRRQFDVILADLGASSPHFDRVERGFSFGTDGPLDMRMDQRQAVTAASLVNGLKEVELKNLLVRYGEEGHAARITRAIVDGRPFTTTGQLAHAIEAALPRRGSKIHPATKTFQALRIAVNGELELLEDSLPLWLQLLAPGGRIAVISFHSLEDRLVKQALVAAGGDRYDAELRLLTKRPVVAGPAEIAFNPRARSAKLRAAVKK